MKRIYSSLALVLLSTLPVVAQAPLNWTLVNTGTNKNIRDISFMNKDTGIIAGDDGLLKMTTNGGASWTDMTLPSTGQGTGNNNNIKVAQFFDYAGSIGGVLFFDKFTAVNRTYDLTGGWMEECGGGVFSPAGDSICSINNFHHNQSFSEYVAGGTCLGGGGIVGYFGGFCFSFDSLRSDVSFTGWNDITANQDVIVTVGANGFFANATVPWAFTLHQSGTGYNYLSVDWSDTSTIYAANDSGGWLLEKSTDGGNTFVVDSTIGPNFYYPIVAEMDFTEDDWGVMACASNLYNGVIITKRGSQIDFFNTDSLLTSAFVLDSTLAFAGGLDGKLYKLEQSGGMGITPVVENIDFSIFPNPQYAENDLLNLFVEEEVKEIIIYDITGKVLMDQFINRQGSISINTGIRTAGTYIVRVVTNKGVGTRKYVVN